MKAIQASAAPEMRLIGGRLCLDFINTVDGRKSDSPRRESRSLDRVLGDKLTEYSDLVEWSRHSGIVTPTEAERLIQEGKMKKAGMQQVELAKADGRWQQAYDSSKNMKVPEDFLQQLSKNKKAKTFFDGLNKANLYAIAWRLQTAKKPETREKRLKENLEMMSEGKKFH